MGDPRIAATRPMTRPTDPGAVNPTQPISPSSAALTAAPGLVLDPSTKCEDTLCSAGVRMIECVIDGRRRRLDLGDCPTCGGTSLGRVS